MRLGGAGGAGRVEEDVQAIAASVVHIARSCSFVDSSPCAFFPSLLIFKEERRGGACDTT